jgi:hypothetical protein
VSIQGYLKATGRTPLTSLQMRDLLVSTGTPEANPAVKVGPFPNLRAAVARVDQLYPIPGTP